jgi:hypothetical protein
MSFYLSICAIFKNENDYLAEWLAFHHLMGIEHFYLYENDGEEKPHAILAPFIERGLVTLRNCPGSLAQARAYDHCIQSEKNNSRWIAFIDLDEFLFSPASDSLPKILKNYESHVALGVNWLMFGSSGWLKKPSGLTIENYTWRGKLDFVLPMPHLLKKDGSHRQMNSHIKSIVNPKQVKNYSDPHSFLYTNNQFAVTENYKPIQGPWSETISVSQLRINHYWSRSREECLKKIQRGRADTNQSRTLSECEIRDRLLNEELDTEITRYINPVKQYLNNL